MISVKEQIDILIQLQKIDARIYALREELEERPKEIDLIKAKFQEGENLLKTIEEKSRNKKLKLKEMELDLKSKEENVKKLQIQLYQVKTNKEYASMQKEIDGLKADNSLLEEEIIGYLDEIDNLGKEINKGKEALEQERREMENKTAEIEKEINALREELKILEGEHSRVAAGIERVFLAKYERILANKNGRALAQVLHDSCSGCNIGLPPQVVNEVRLGEKIVTCENCLRILYI